MSKEETMVFIKNFIGQLEQFKDTPESELPECSADNLWQDEPTYKYYKNPNSRKRSTANFTTFYDAQAKFILDGAVGVVVTVPAKAKACHYCPAYNSCTQKDRLIAEGTLDAK